MRMRRFYTFYGGMVEVIIRGYSLSCSDIWCSILVYHYLFAVCALLVSLVVCCAACFLIMRYRANNSPFCLLVVHIRQRAFNMVLCCSSDWKVLFLLCGLLVLLGALWGCLLVGSLCGIVSLLVRRLFPFCCTFFHVVVYCAPRPYMK